MAHLSIVQRKTVILLLLWTLYLLTWTDLPPTISLMFSLAVAFVTAAIVATK